MKLSDIFKQVLNENNISLKKRYKDILDDITDEKIGEKEYINYEYIDDLGGKAFGRIEDGIAYITQMNSQPIDKQNTDELKRRGFFSNLVHILKNNNVNSIVINLQSDDTRKAVKRLIEKGKLKNPRNYKGISTDQHPTLFEI